MNYKSLNIISFIQKKEVHKAVWMFCQRTPLGTWMTSTIMERLTHPALAWSARFPFLAKADDVCTVRDDSIGITQHTCCMVQTGFQPHEGQR